MFKNKTIIAIVTIGLMFSHQALAVSDFSKYTDPRFGNSYHSDEQRLFFDSQKKEGVFLNRQSLFRPEIVTDEKQINSLFKQYTKGVKPPKEYGNLQFSTSKYARVNAASIVSFLFRNYISKNNAFIVPFVISTDKNRETTAYDQYYDAANLCSGMGYFESNLKNICVIKNRDKFGLVELNYDRNLGLYNTKKRIRQLPTNGIQESFSHKLFLTFAPLIGFYSHHSKTGFESPLSTLDYHLISSNSFITDKVKFSDLSKKCNYDSFSSCHLKFVGMNTESLFENSSNHKVQEDFDAKERLQIHFTKSGTTKLNLRNSILSDSSFINYGFYIQAELELFKDLGYNINSREFFGTSIYSSGTPEKRGNYNISSSFTAWNGEIRQFSKDKASLVPLSIGTHVYGNYNDVTQSSIIASKGFSSIGIRVDGSRNKVTLPKHVSIYENGDSSIGIAVAYGRNNSINIDGDIEANGTDGIGVSLDFGSNALSDMKEYRGSYRRVRSYDYVNGKLSKQQAEAYNVPNTIRGPLVSELNISGKVSGDKYSIYVDDSAHVSDINLIHRAKIKGNIVSKWDFYVNSDENAFYSEAYNSKLLDGKLQFDSLYGDKINTNSFKNKLYTNINLGIKYKDSKHSSRSAFIADDKSNIDIDGNIVGKTININSIAGLTHINGYVDVSKLFISDSAVNLLSSGKNAPSNVAKLELSKGGQLDLTDGVGQTFVVKNSAVISNNAVICVDADKDGSILDHVDFQGDLSVSNRVLNIEPGVSYNEIKRYTSDPKALLDFMNNFVREANSKLTKYDVYTRFPKHIWYTQGEMGRKVNCSPRGCYIGDFVNSYSNSSLPLPLWRYILSISGCLLLLVFSVFLIRKTGSGRFG